MTEQQQQAFDQLPSMKLVATTVAGARGVLVRLTGGLFVLSPSGLLRRFS